MIRKFHPKQNCLDFGFPFSGKLNPNNRWIKLADAIPWQSLCSAYESKMCADNGTPAKSARVVIGALILKHKLNRSDEEIIEQIRENRYLQYFLGLPCYSDKQVFTPSLFVEIRRRLDSEAFAVMEQAIVDAAITREKNPTGDSGEDNDNDNDNDDNQSTKSADSKTTESQPIHKGTLIVDATVAPQAIRFPTDVGLLNEARENTEVIVDKLYEQCSKEMNKPRTYRKVARKSFLCFIRNRRPQRATIGKAIKHQLQFIHRNLKHIDTMFDVLQAQSPSGKTL